MAKVRAAAVGLSLGASALTACRPTCVLQIEASLAHLALRRVIELTG